MSKAFQIVDKEGKAVTLSELDKQAAEVWGVEVDEKHYAAPTKDEMKVSGLNWYDTIGFRIANPNQRWATGWKNVLNELFITCMNGCAELEDEELHWQIVAAKEFMKPYKQLINYWRAKGYEPKQVEE